MHDEKFHRFDSKDLRNVDLPKQFTFPFHYTPHPLCIKAAEYVQNHLLLHDEWQEELKRGKMMGVLVVEKENEMGFLAAFSGNLAHCNNHPYFVPAVYDLLSEKGFFRPEEDEISTINKKINKETHSPERKNAIEDVENIKTQANTEISAYKQFMKASKAQRDEQRKQGIDNNLLIAESQFQKAELKRIQVRWQQEIDTAKSRLDAIDNRIAQWKTERSKRSATLQERIFSHFIMLNASGESRDLCEIFADTPQHTPPAGAGECAAPKLLQYAYTNSYHPLAMAEFWVGNSPKEEIRRHGCFYPSCKAKCEPILGWMLQGLDVEPNPLEKQIDEAPLNVIFEDEWLIVVNKPAGMLSIPGKLSSDSLQERVQRLRPGEEPPTIVHRLDMATSGLLIFAKTKEVHKRMQALFKTHDIKKQYTAILDGEIQINSGEIRLPLILNPKERPLQMVSHTHGKPAITRFEVVSCSEGKTRVHFYPITGRTHQLRIHAAHPEGLNTPIIGDTLYGTPADRLYLHAETLDFTHPITGKHIHLATPCPF
jgi:tRNA pseudouridine32 synthase/23S rRNA pseudouridine746 synthase